MRSRPAAPEKGPRVSVYCALCCELRTGLRKPAWLRLCHHRHGRRRCARFSAKAGFHSHTPDSSLSIHVSLAVVGTDAADVGNLRAMSHIFPSTTQLWPTCIPSAHLKAWVPGGSHSAEHPSSPSVVKLARDGCTFGNELGADSVAIWPTPFLAHLTSRLLPFID